jgi:hypothetical protein
LATIVGDYAKRGCNVGAFPAFRRLDCEDEVEIDAWSFYRSYESKCLKGDDGIPPNAAPNAAPVAGPTKPPTKASPKPVPSPVAPSPVAPSGNQPTLKPYIPADGGGKPYKPSDEKEETKTKTKKKSHWFRNFVLLCMLGAGGYYVYKQRFDTFNFVQYRRMGRNFNFGDGMYGGGGAADGSMYTNLNSSTTFEPPTLPPTPTMMMGTEMT